MKFYAKGEIGGEPDKGKITSGVSCTADLKYQVLKKGRKKCKGRELNPKQKKALKQSNVKMQGWGQSGSPAKKENILRALICKF